MRYQITPFISGLMCALALLIPFLSVMMWWTDSYQYGLAGLGRMGLRPPEVVALAALVVSSLALGWWGGRLIQRETAPRYIKALGIVLLIFLLSWGVFLGTFFLANLTPLCIGQNNGDGNNNLYDCLTYSVLTSVWATSMISVPFAISALATAALLRALPRLR